MTKKAKPTSSNSKKLGKNPFQTEGKSRVGRMIGASFSSQMPEEKQESPRSLHERLQEMKLKLDLKAILRALTGP